MPGSRRDERMRAIETGRWVAQVSPTGFTAVIDDRGRMVVRSSVGEQRVIQQTVELREGLTIYTRLGNLPGVLAALVLIVAGWAVERGAVAGRPRSRWPGPRRRARE